MSKTKINIMDKKEVRVIRFRISLNIEIPDETVYVTEGIFENEFKDDVELVQNAYFDKDKIEFLSKKLQEAIVKSENPFSVYDVDMDMYSVSEDKIWK